MLSRTLFVIALFAVGGCGDGNRIGSASMTAPRATLDEASVPAAERVTASSLWNQRTRVIISRRGGSSNVAARTFALVSVAQYNAVVAAREAKDGGVHPSLAGAAAGAAATVLAGLYSAEQSFVDAQLASDAAYFAMLPSERASDVDAGVAIGRAVGAKVLAYGAVDGSKIAWTGTVPVGSGYWIPISMPPQDANWGGVRPWTLRSADQFRPVPPPVFGSADYLAGLSEVRYYSDTRTPEQLAIARYWATGYGAGGPAGFFGSVGAAFAAREHLNESQASRMFAVLHMAIMDASIGCFEAKYVYWSIRPYQADPAITVPVTRPNFPSYPSAHSCLSSAAGGVLARYFPSEKDSLNAMVDEAGMSRIYAGLHYRFDITAGQKLGHSVARFVMRHAPKEHQPIPLD